MFLGKALRTVKSCVGTNWCRYGIGDSVGSALQHAALSTLNNHLTFLVVAIALEERYKGIRAPHKFKGGVSGCVRECAEAQSKDFGLIATDKGWNSESCFVLWFTCHPILFLVFICGNGGRQYTLNRSNTALIRSIGATPRHATLFARDVPPSHAIRILDRFIMYYIRTADKLMRTARWVEQMDGGIEVGPPRH